MPTRVEVLTDYTDALQRGTYIAMIDQSLAHFTAKNINFTMLNMFMQKRTTRVQAVYNNVEAQYKSEAITSNYILFKDMADNMRGKLEELDQSNGRISQTVFGDVRAQRLRKREMAEINSKIAIYIVPIIGNFESFKTEMDGLKTDINNVGKVA